MDVIDDLEYSTEGRTLYVHHAGPVDRVRQASLEAAVRVAYGLTLADDPRALPDGMLFSTVGYQGSHKLDELTVKTFNHRVALPVIQIAKAGPFEVQVLTGQELTGDNQLHLGMYLDYGVRGFNEHGYLGPCVYALTVQGMDAGPNTQLVQNIGVEMCRLLAERWCRE